MQVEVEDFADAINLKRRSHTAMIALKIILRAWPCYQRGHGKQTSVGSSPKQMAVAIVDGSTADGQAPNGPYCAIAGLALSLLVAVPCR